MKQTVKDATANKILATFLLLLILSGCATSMVYTDNANSIVPILSQDELIKPYTKLGKINISVDLFLSPFPDVKEWGERALKDECEKLGCDAVIFPEISSRPAPHLIIPANEYRATGIAIKFKQQ